MESKKSESDNQKIHIFLAPGAHVVGDVTLGENVGIWYNAVVRGDTGSIFIDDNSNVQDNSTLHTDEGHSIHIGKGVPLYGKSIPESQRQFPHTPPKIQNF